MAYSFVHNKYFLSLSSTPALPAHPLLISHFSVTISSFVVSPHWPSLPSPWGTASLMTSSVVSQQSSAFCTNISTTSTSPPLSPFLSWAKNTLSPPTHVANDHLQSSLLHPLTPLSFRFNPFHISVLNVCYIQIRLATFSGLCDLKIPSLLFRGQRISCAFGVTLDSFGKTHKCTIFK